MTAEDDAPAETDESRRLLETRLRDRAAALSAEGRDQIADIVRAWADLHALRRRG
jgi:hypothetical protein